MRIRKSIFWQCPSNLVSSLELIDLSTHGAAWQYGRTLIWARSLRWCTCRTVRPGLNASSKQSLAEAAPAWFSTAQSLAVGACGGKRLWEELSGRLICLLNTTAGQTMPHDLSKCAGQTMPHDLSKCVQSVKIRIYIQYIKTNRWLWLAGW